MLRVTVELVPHGSEKHKSDLGRMEIVNTGGHPERPQKGDYTVQVVTNTPDRVLVTQRTIRDYPRLERNVWGLVLEAILSLDNKEGRKHDS